MRNVIKPVLFVFLVAAAVSCKKDAKAPAADEISRDVLNKISALGFTNKNVIKDDGGYIVEGDILLTEESLNGAASAQFLRVGTEEQYRTFNLVTALPRVITVSVSNKLPLSYVAATDEAIARYNAQGLLLTFQRVSSGANISIIKGTGNYLASAGFPSSSGAPYSQVKVNSTQLSGQPQATVASVIAHEMGHCIGFRHTDYMSRQYSCGGAASNEGASTVGAVLIPGTPSGPDPNSWMLSCIGSGQNRPFNANDRTALAYLY
jgi:hypothetical protein